jgi:hypothetical protein
MALAAIMMALFTRETAERYKHLDRAFVSRDSCLKANVVLITVNAGLRRSGVT